MKKSACFMVLAVLLYISPSKAPVLSEPAAQAGGLSFRDIVGTNGLLPGPELNNQLKVGFARVQVAWSGISTSKGSYNWARTDKLASQAQSLGIGVLADLTYTAAWASTNTNHANANWQFAPPQDVSDWTDFVDAAVTRYMASPYNIKYFQVWNEPTKGAGFWQGATNQQWIDMIYIPAAKVIRSHGAKVVFGGWPINGGVQAFNNELNYHNAWQYTDILDLHYYPVVGTFRPLYNQWIASGKCKGLWETEIGAANNPALVTSQYADLYNWARTEGHWSFPDQYKLFWFPGFGANDNTALTREANGKVVLTANGQALAALAKQFQ